MSRGKGHCVLRLAASNNFELTSMLLELKLIQTHEFAFEIWVKANFDLIESWQCGNLTQAVDYNMPAIYVERNKHTISL